MSISQGFAKLDAEALFTSQMFCQVDQLADIIFSDYEQIIKLNAEHEAVIPCWIMSSIENSQLAKKVNLPITVHQLSIEAYQALSIEAQNALMHRQHTWLYLNNGALIRASEKNQRKLKSINTDNSLNLILNQQVITFPDLSFDDQCKVLKILLGKLYHSTQINIPKHSIARALYWQSLYTQKQTVFSQAIRLIRRAINRLLIVQTEVGQVTLLEPHHIAEVLSDWEQISLAEILRPNNDPVGMSLYLNSNVIAQTKAIEKIVANTNMRRAFILAGPRYSGRHTFAKFYAKFLNSHERFCVEIDLRWLDTSKAWHEIVIKSPCADGRYLLLRDLVIHYPRTVFLLTHIESELETHAQQLQDFMRCAQQGVAMVNDITIDFSHVTWFLLFDTKTTAIIKSQSGAGAGTETKTNLDAEESLSKYSEYPGSESESDLGLAGLEEILYQKSATEKQEEAKNCVELEETFITEHVFSALPSYMQDIADSLFFSPLADTKKQMIIGKALKSTIRRLRIQWKFPLYFQEEVINYLFNLVNTSEDGLTKLPMLLQEKVCDVFQHALKTRSITDQQAFMLQLNESGLLLTAVVVEQPSVLQNQRAINFNHQQN